MRKATPKKELEVKNKKAKNPLPSRSNNGNRFVTEIKFNNDAQVNADGIRTLNSTAKTADNKKTLKCFYRTEENLKLLLSLFCNKKVRWKGLGDPVWEATSPVAALAASVTWSWEIVSKCSFKMENCYSKCNITLKYGLFMANGVF